MSEGLEVARLFLSDSVPIVLTQSKAMAADPPRALSSATTRLPLTGEAVRPFLGCVSKYVVFGNTPHLWDLGWLLHIG